MYVCDGYLIFKVHGSCAICQIVLARFGGSDVQALSLFSCQHAIEGAQHRAHVVLACASGIPCYKDQCHLESTSTYEHQS